MPKKIKQKTYKVKSTPGYEECDLFFNELCVINQSNIKLFFKNFKNDEFKTIVVYYFMLLLDYINYCETDHNEFFKNSIKESLEHAEIYPNLDNKNQFIKSMLLEISKYFYNKTNNDNGLILK